MKRQAVLCHRVLRTVQYAAIESLLLKKDTWDALLKFLLSINDTLLAPPSQAGKFLSNFLNYFRKALDLKNETKIKSDLTSHEWDI